jgi:hypothetical protein
MIYLAFTLKDGFGSQLQQYIWSIIYGELHGHTVYISYDTRFDHNYDGEEDFNKRILDYMNLHKYYGLPDELKEQIIPTISTNFTHMHWCWNNINTTLESDSFKRIKTRFMENKINPYDSAFYNVAIHIRRPNPHDNRILGTDTPDEYFLNIINIIRQEHSSDKPLRFHIYSQGDKSNFNKYLSKDVILHLNDTIENTMDGLLFGDILVTSPSSLSYIAGYFTNGKVYYKPFWVPPAKTWRIM